jgi:exosome complex RNA-binding protein Rrp4
LASGRRPEDRFASAVIAAMDARARGIQRREGVYVERGEVTDLVPLTVTIPASNIDVSAPHILRDPKYVPEVGDMVIVVSVSSGEWFIAPVEMG